MVSGSTVTMLHGLGHGLGRGIGYGIGSDRRQERQGLLPKRPQRPGLHYTVCSDPSLSFALLSLNKHLSNSYFYRDIFFQS